MREDIERTPCPGAPAEQRVTIEEVLAQLDHIVEIDPEPEPGLEEGLAELLSWMDENLPDGDSTGAEKPSSA